ncbi:GNAT family N-acetyltransferase [Bacillus sp. UMB0899]|nr:GNAT family N-acetyltransferase [Bacillus sp. UMB0899]
MEQIFSIDCGEFILREYKLEDADAIYNLALEEKIYRYLPDWKTTREQRLEWVRDYEMPGNAAFLEAVSDNVFPEGYFRLGIVLKENNKFIGWCCIGPKLELPKPNTEIFYAITKDYEGRGFVTKASMALIDYILKETKIETLNALAEIDNVGSNKVIQKCGFKFVEQININDKIHNHYKMQKKIRKD